MAQQKQEKPMTLAGAVSMGIGGMVGGGIFAVLGLAVSTSKGATFIAFLIAGTITALTAYSYAKLSVAFPSTGGTTRFIHEGFGKNLWSGGLNTLLWLSYIVMLSLYSSAFGSYAVSLIPKDATHPWMWHAIVSGMVIFSTGLNYFNARVIGQIESWVVGIKVTILLLMTIGGLWLLSDSQYLDQMNPDSWPDAGTIIAGGMMIFVAYEGFELIANTSSNIERPTRNLPLAYGISVGFVVLLYVMISIVTVGSLSFDKIQSAEEYVLAEVAKPLMGQLGFTVVAITALLSTFSATLSTLYGGSRVNYQVADDDELPHGWARKVWNEPLGLILTSGVTLIFANTVNLESISTSGSLGFLFIFGMVNLAHVRRSQDTGGKSWISVIGAILCFVAAGALIVQQFESNPKGAWIALGIIIGSFAIELFYKKSES
ncbi:APC family permease [Pontibacter sp. G13]|uniref:APC family permease n=1 Tax=Pontibacter sp. G13 TaxID=3074898 RepID=UPI00288AF5B3|nr:APC family permease [Pontibacter sp. G13]WNJ21301.1 APC family permease [Pontibacter sp. G13]